MRASGRTRPRCWLSEDDFVWAFRQHKFIRTKSCVLFAPSSTNRFMLSSYSVAENVFEWVESHHRSFTILRSECERNDFEMAVFCTIPSPIAKSAGGHRIHILASVANAHRISRMRWISEPTSFKTEIPDFAGASLRAATTSRKIGKASLQLARSDQCKSIFSDTTRSFPPQITEVSGRRSSSRGR